MRCLYQNLPEKDCGARACPIHGTPSASPYGARRGAIIPTEEESVPQYIVIENTPGYLPEDDDPFITDDYAAAVAYMNERAASYADDPDANYRVEVGIASPNNYAAVMVWDDDKTHDLGRYIGVELCEDDN